MSLLYDPRRASISGSRPALSAAERAFRQVWGAVNRTAAVYHEHVMLSFERSDSSCAASAGGRTTSSRSMTR